MVRGGTPKVSDPVERVRDYQRHAAECVLLAEQVHDPVSKGNLLAMAQGWARLAELALKNSRNDLVYETPDVARSRDHAWRAIDSRRAA
jgi:hypothetical protein